MKKRGITRAELARRLGVTRATISALFGRSKTSTLVRKVDEILSMTTVGVLSPTEDALARELIQLLIDPDRDMDMATRWFESLSEQRQKEIEYGVVKQMRAALTRVHEAELAILDASQKKKEAAVENTILGKCLLAIEEIRTNLQQKAAASSKRK